MQVLHPEGLKFILVVQYHMQALHPQGLRRAILDSISCTCNTKYYSLHHYTQEASANNMSRTKTAEATTTCSSVSSTVEGNLTPIVPNTVDFPPLSGAQVTTTTTMMMTTTMTASSVTALIL